MIVDAQEPQVAELLSVAADLVALVRRPQNPDDEAPRLRIAHMPQWSTEVAHSPGTAVIPIVQERIWAAAFSRTSDAPGDPQPSVDSLGGGYALVVEVDEHRDWSSPELSGLRTVGASLARELRWRSELALARRIATWEQVHRLRDPVTELPSRDLFVERVELAVHRAARHRASHFAVLAVDVDRLGEIYHALGREVGDALLRSVAERLKPLVRLEDLLARSPSEGFLILLDEVTDALGASRVAVRIQSALSTPLHVEGREIRVTPTIGISLSVGGIESPDAIIQAASVARVRAQERGTGEFQLFEPEMQERVRRRLGLEVELRRAVEHEQFEVFYQPLISLETGAITELEAMVRWNHPTRGRVTAGEFIPFAEESQLILSIGNWVIINACRQVSEWRRKFAQNPPGLTVNVAARLLAIDDFTATIRGILATSGLPPDALRLEITESVLIANPAAARAKLSDLRAAGVAVYLDDFGAGYSSLRYLRDLPLDGIKLDRAFIEHMTRSGPGEAPDMPIVRTVRQLARDMGVRAIAEGIETAEQLLALREFGYDLAQGYYIGRPMPAAEMEQLLRGSSPSATARAN